MTRKLTAVIVLTCMLFAMLTPCTYAAEAPFYKLIAEESFTTGDYTGSKWGGQISGTYAKDGSGNPVITGKGFTSNWLVKENDGYTAPANSAIQLYFFDGSSNPGIRLNKVRAVLYRTLKNKIDFNNASGEYTMSFTAKSIYSGAGSNRKGSEISIGESVAFGFKWAEGYAKVIPYVKVNGNTIFSDASVTMQGGDSAKAHTVITLKLALNSAGDDTITVSASYPNETTATASTVAEVSGIAEYIAFDLDTGYFDDFKLEYNNQAAYDRITNIIQNGTTDAAELQVAIADLADYSGDDRETLLTQLKAHATGALEGVANLKLVSITPAVSAPILVNDAKKFELEYNYPLADGTVFNIYNTFTNEPIAGTVCTVNKNKVTLTYDGTLESGIPYAIKATGTDFKGDTISGIPFSISALPEINVSNNAHYTQGKTIEWAEDENAVVTALLNGQEIQNGDSILIPGEYALSITVTKNGISETVVLNITIDEDFAPVASNVEIKGTAGVGQVLQADFDYYDANGDAEGQHSIVWYKVSGTTEIEIGYGATYTIKKSDRNSDIIAGVTPKAATGINNEGETEYSEPFRCVYAPTDITTDPFYELIAEDTISPADYSVVPSNNAGGNITKSYTIDPNTGKPVITGKGWKANWVVRGAADLGFRAITDSDNVWYYSVNSENKVIKLNNMPVDTTLYRQLATPIEFGNTADKFSFKIDVQDGSAGAGGSSFRFKIGNSIVAGYDYASDKSKIVPVLEVNGASVPNSNTLTMGNGGDGGKFITLTVTVELTQGGADTVTLIANEKGAAANAARVMVATGAELSGKCEYVGIGTVSGATTLLRVDNLKIEYSNLGRFEEILDIAANGTADATELKAAIADLAGYNGADRADIINQLKAHATGSLTGADVIELLSISHNVENMLYVRDIESFELKYNFKLDDVAEFGIYNKATGDAAEGVASEVAGTDAEITLSQKLENGVVYEIRATGTDFKGDAIPAIEFKTSPIPDINITNGGNYSERSSVQWTEDVNTTVTAVLKDASGNEQNISNGYVLETIGAFELTVTASKNGINDTAVMNITVEEDIAPVASNVKITGIAATDAVIEAGFDFYDANSDAEGSHIIVWYKNTTDGKVEIGRGRTYTLKQSDENCDIVVGVTPVAISNVKPQGAEVFSEMFKGAYKPVASDVKILGVIEENKELEVTYTFSDINGDEKDTPFVKWFIKGENGDVEITENITDGKLTITSDLFEKYVYAKLTPVSARKPYNGDAVITEVVLMPAAPVVSNVRIEGNTSVGGVLTAYYSFEDPNLDAEGLSRFEWKDSAGNVIGRERKLNVTDGMAGKIITVTVVGVSEKTPCDSAPAVSAAVTISGGVSGIGGSTGGVVTGGGGFGYSGGSSGSASGGSSSGGSTGTTTPVTPATPIVPEKETVFGDVYGHWAQEYVTVLLEKGVVTKDESFRPDDSISRAEVLAMLFRSAGIKLSKYNGAYGDVKDGDWFADYIQTALDAQIISHDDKFRPNDGITREEAAKIIAIMLKLKSENAADFADASAISDWAAEYVNAVYEAGIFKGDDEGNFSPKGALTRAETAAVIYRLLNDNAFAKEVPDNEK